MKLETGSPLLTIQNVTKTYATPEGGTVQALKGVSLDINQGEFIVLLGPSGCGKTTLLRTIAGLEYPDSGEIYLEGERIDDKPAFLRPVNTVFQSYALFPHMSVAENIAFGLEMEKLSKEEIAKRVEATLVQIKLEGYGRRKPSQLSGGQQQRVALGRALIKGPRVLLLDEPLSALDLKLRRGMQVELKRLQQDTGITFVFVTHDQEEAMSMGDRIAVFNEGEIVQLDTPREMYRNPANRFVADFIGETNLIECEINSGSVSIKGQNISTNYLAENAVIGSNGTSVVAIRPEDLVISGNRGILTGIVRDIIFTGSAVRIHVMIGNEEIVAVLPSHGVAVPERGQEVHMNAIDGTIRVLAS
ncbi:MAG: ABC transporter ATP-binding protein [Actinomycetes bacterium]